VEGEEWERKHKMKLYQNTITETELETG
jgi:hypothetical protein